MRGGNEVRFEFGAAGEDRGGIMLVCDSVLCGDSTWAMLILGGQRRGEIFEMDSEYDRRCRQKARREMLCTGWRVNPYYDNLFK